ncbi:MAG: metal-dependent hydrolase [Parasphingopyxis sp.]|uniref:metal-dependent hydrolase n=1 Tax=Parasphingopyxis sp. TaxID=1920299 RepID=UPI003F9FDDF5
MDNLTHSLAGAVLGQIGLKKKTGLGMATLIIAANIPDIDALAAVLGGHQHLAIRRGITHGPLAMLILPVLLTGIMIAFDRWQERREKRPEQRLPIHKGWLLALAYIGTLSHPALDYLNNYGIRLLEPFSSNWVYGDTLFIIDVWVWAALGIALWLSLRRERQGREDWRRPAVAAVAIVIAYIGANGLISSRAEHLTAEQVAAVRDEPAELVVANNLPLTFWARDMHWRGQGEIGSGHFTLFGGEDMVTLNDDARPDGMDTVDWDAVTASNPDARAYLFWARMPFVERRDGRVLLRDQRFTFDGIGDRFIVDVTPSE